MFQEYGFQKLILISRMLLQASTKDNAKKISKLDCDYHKILYLFMWQVVLQNQLLKHIY